MTVKHKYLFSLMGLVILCGQLASAQPSTTAITYDKEPGGTLAFTKMWSYPWYMQKFDDGKFSKQKMGKSPLRTLPIYFLPLIVKTNVQGGYQIRYCYATKTGSNLKLNFSDGAPVYASEFNIKELLFQCPL